VNVGPRPTQGLLRVSLDASQSLSSTLSWGCNIPQVPPYSPCMEVGFFLVGSTYGSYLYPELTGNEGQEEPHNWLGSPVTKQMVPPSHIQGDMNDFCKAGGYPL